MALPCELIDEVLCHVPVKYLLRCRCVSKEWCSLIDSTAFIKKHAKTTIESNASSGIVITGDQSLFLTDAESLYADEDVAVTEIKDPLVTVFPGADFVGASNSLLCFCKNNWNDFLLYNPSTRKHKKVPSIGEFVLWFDFVLVSHCGFGYDHVNDDYKIVKIAEFCGMVVMVYSLKSNQWTQIHNVPNNILIHPLSRKGMFAHGALHWLAAKNLPGSSYIILGFDLGFERFREIPSPVARNGKFYVADGGSLCILEECTNSRTDAWLINNYGAENPWYKALSMEQPGALGSFRVYRPVVSSRSGKDVLLEVDISKLVWYDPERKVVKNVRIHGLPSKFGAELYRESLLQLSENEQLQKPSKDKKEKKQQKERDNKEKKQQTKRDNFLSKGFKLKL
ncbi:F-box domain-containing protein [Heracleum sosnowskyi]|uniref:F-box domain-containing protein n=1 Tax=Heracleum sosnowskyi TaxID=360622 RepID=A0AAD8M0T8_9APIA|nr:F-box domain-containing protein [Heracleum sosnowskyi]